MMTLPKLKPKQTKPLFQDRMYIHAPLPCGEVVIELEEQVSSLISGGPIFLLLLRMQGSKRLTLPMSLRASILRCQDQRSKILTCRPGELCRYYLVIH